MLTLAAASLALAQSALVPPANIAAESTHCFYLESDYNGDLVVGVVGMDSGITSEFLRVPGAHVGSTSGMAHDGGDLLVFPDRYDWVELNVAQGTLRKLPKLGYDDAVTFGRGHFMVFDNSPGEAAGFETVDRLADNDPNGVFGGFGGTYSRFQIAKDKVFTAWHSTDEVDVFDLDSGIHLGTILLQDWDTWVHGISVAGGMLHLIDDARGLPGQTNVRIARFDAQGNQIDQVFLPHLGAFSTPSGLYCSK